MLSAAHTNKNLITELSNEFEASIVLSVDIKRTEENLESILDLFLDNHRRTGWNAYRYW